MNNNYWKEIFITKLKQNELNFNELYEILVRMRDAGWDSKSAYDFLTKLHADKHTLVYEDLLLDLMDIATGYCSPRLRIWDN